jgi:hypothetical protein
MKQNLILGLLGFIATLITILIRGQNNERRKYIYIYTIIAIAVISIAAIAFFWKKPIPKTPIAKYLPELLLQGFASDTISYFEYEKILEVDTNIAKKYTSVRIQLIKSFYDTADIQLRHNNGNSYIGLLKSHFAETSNGFDEILIEKLRSKNYLAVNERLISPDKLHFKVFIAKNGRYTDKLVAEVRENICLLSVFKQIVSDPLSKNGRIEISLSQFYSSMCASCGDSPLVLRLKKLCGDQNLDCSSIYFDNGEFHLSEFSKAILDNFIDKFRLSAYKLQVEFHGYTDPIPVSSRHIRSSDGLLISEVNNLLPNPNKGRVIYEIENNDQLSFARAYSCYKYIYENKDLRNISLKYTGCGESTELGSNSKKRNVKIIISKTN